jgi:hypothetical protein
MESVSIIIWSILILVIALLIFLRIQKKISKEKRIQKTLQDLADQSNGNISEYDHWFNTLIGIDKKNKQLFFVRNMAAKEVVKVINLAEIQICRINNVSRTVTNGNGSSTNVIDRLELSLKYQKPSVAEDILEFYNTNGGNWNLNDELKLVEKWNILINEELK